VDRQLSQDRLFLRLLIVVRVTMIAEHGNCDYARRAHGIISILPTPHVLGQVQQVVSRDSLFETLVTTTSMAQPTSFSTCGLRFPEPGGIRKPGAVIRLTYEADRLLRTIQRSWRLPCISGWWILGQPGPPLRDPGTWIEPGITLYVGPSSLGWERLRGP
jgi:hypothetical protein